MTQAFEPYRRDADADPQDSKAELRAILRELRALGHGASQDLERAEFLSFFESHWTPGQARNAWSGRPHILIALIRSEPEYAAAAFEVLTCCQISTLLVEAIACEVLDEGGPASWLAFDWLASRERWRPAVADGLGRFLAQARHSALYGILQKLPGHRDELEPMLPWLVKILRHTDSGLLRRRIIQVFGKLGAQAWPVAEVLVEAFEFGPARQKMSLVRSFGGIGPRIAGLVIPRLRASWRRPRENWLRGAIAETLALLGDDALEALIFESWAELSESQKRSAVMSLSQVEAPGRLLLIEEVAASTDWALRRTCAQALQKSCGQPARERRVLGALLSDGHWRVRLAALDALRARGQAADFELLQERCDRLPPSTRRRAKLALDAYSRS